MNDDVLASAPWPPRVDLVVSLDGEEAALYEEFRLAAKALEATGLAHQEAQRRYRAALEKLSAVASAKVP